MLRSKQKPKVQDTGFVLFDVYYEDGSRRSNRRVPRTATMEHDVDGAVRQVIEEQDRDIAEKSGRPPLAITKIVRSAD
ncbi:hypothetical protein SAMN02799631_05334 [Methylobacterium sp. 174MFSha1.1]|uniref:hypothetical protein n=1 Tax=Methylobacterium sp. 174MFSha1.1 TaxID=1502749 RepID=UPI0008EEDBD9|nr:hypothetical protein [Methylobacterium sp. 174MFSha1.1]SFV11784.1 hypothetical protein SAMN02799631_05334 [Methylobacterium sp. 174MFSha1.1]